MAIKIKSARRLESILEDLKKLFGYKSADKKEINLQQIRDKQKYKKDIKKRKAQEFEGYLFKSRYQGV